MTEDPDMRAHRLAEAITERVANGTASIYNTARNVLIEEFVRERERFEHDWFDPGDKWPRLRRVVNGHPLLSCSRCGVNKGAVSVTKECPGQVKIELRS